MARRTAAAPCLHPFLPSSTHTPTEPPKPDLACLSDLRSLCLQVARASCPTELGYSYEEVKGMDDISVTIMPEKKGMVFKHVEYLVESRVSGGGRRWTPGEWWGEEVDPG